MQQLSLFNDLQEALAYHTEDYLLLNENQHTYNLLMNGDWNTFVLYGGAGSGKTHLAHLWGRLYDAQFVTLDNFISHLANSSAFILEDIHCIEDQEKFLHCFNYLKEHKKRLLMTSAVPPSLIDSLTLKDLCSRLKASMSSALIMPTQELIKVMLIQEFSRRQLKVDVKVINFILNHVERSFDGVKKIAEQIDRLSQATLSGVTIPLVKVVIGHSQQ